MTAQPARTDLRVTLEPIRRDERRILFRFERMDNKARRDFILVDPGKRVEALKADLPSLLNSFRAAIGQKKGVALTPLDMQRAKNQLDWLANGILDRMLPGAQMIANGKEVPIGPQSFQREVSTLLFSMPPLINRPWNKPLVIEVSASDELPLAWHLPLEVFPVALPGSGQGEVRSGSRVTHEDFLSYLGMLAVVVRRRDASKEATPRSAVTPFALVAYTGSPPMAGIRAQLQYFNIHAGKQLSGAMVFNSRTGALAVDGAVDDLAEIMSIIQTLPATGHRPVLHFCCHYGSTGPNGPSLGLKSDLEVSIASLRGRLAMAPYPEFPPKDAHRPFVFLNACESASLGRGDESLLRLLFHRGYRHIIGGETRLPDQFAGAFARHFYEFALQGEPLGNALWKTRRYVLERYGNPGGLLYAMYGSPDIRIH